MMEGIKYTDFQLSNLVKKTTGKVRDVYDFGDKIAFVVTDRISAFDVILPRTIPYKGQVLNIIAAKSLKSVEDIMPIWLENVPHPNVAIGKNCHPYKIEMVIRGYLTGHAWREYHAGKRTLCGNILPEGMKENQKFLHPIITPTTKAQQGKDEDISKEEIIHHNLISKEDYEQLEQYTYKLFDRGTEIAGRQGLILVDTKYEFASYKGKIYLIDEIHTPDSSRFFYKKSYLNDFEQNRPQRQLSKEFVRQWLIDNGFQGKPDQKVPEMTDEVVASISQRYIELYENILGKRFVKEKYTSNLAVIKQSLETL